MVVSIVKRVGKLLKLCVVSVLKCLTGHVKRGEGFTEDSRGSQMAK